MTENMIQLSLWLQDLKARNCIRKLRQKEKIKPTLQHCGIKNTTLCHNKKRKNSIQTAKRAFKTFTLDKW